MNENDKDWDNPVFVDIYESTGIESGLGRIQQAIQILLLDYPLH